MENGHGLSEVKETDLNDPQKDYELARLAEKLEKVMFEHGEYEKSDDKRLRWFKWLLDWDKLKDFPAAMHIERVKVTNEIYQSLTSGMGAMDLQKYLFMLYTLEQQPKNQQKIPEDVYNNYMYLYGEMNRLVNPVFLAYDIKSFNELGLEVQSSLTKEDFKVMSTNLTFMPINEYLFNEFGYADYDISVIDINDIVGGVTCGYDVGETVFNEDLFMISDEIKAKAIKMMLDYEPMVLVDERKAAPSPFLFKKDTGEIFTVDNIREQIEELGKGETLTAYGKPHYDSAGHLVQDQVPVEVMPAFSYKILHDSVSQKLDEINQVREHYNHVLLDFLKANGYELEIYAPEILFKLHNPEKDNYVMNCYTNEPAMYKYTETLLNVFQPELKAIAAELEIEAAEIIATSEYADQLPVNYSGWKHFVSDYNMRDENVRMFAQRHKSDIEIMELAGNPKLADVKHTYYAQKEEKQAALDSKKTKKQIGKT